MFSSSNIVKNEASSSDAQREKLMPQLSTKKLAMLPVLLPKNISTRTQNEAGKLLTTFKNKKTSKWHLFAEGFVGLGLPQRQFKADNFDLNVYLDKRAMSEQPLEVAIAGAYLGFKQSSGLNWKTGLTAQQLTEVFQYESEQSEEFKAHSDTAFFVQYPMERVYFPDSVTATQTTRRMIKHYNRHSFYQIPLLIGFEKI